MVSETEEKPGGRGLSRVTWIKLAVAGLMAAVCGVLLLRGVDLHALVERVFDTVKGAGAGWFFVSMATLPAFGFPIGIHYLLAGPSFVRSMGVPAVLLCGSTAIAVNAALTYWLARYALRPWTEKLVRGLGWKLPAVRPEDHLGLAILVRATPGLPFFAQGYLLGLAEMPFRPYFLVSWIVSSIHFTAFVLATDALRSGEGKWAFMGAGLFVGAVAAMSLLRKRVRRRNAAVAAEAEDAGRGAPRAVAESAE